MNKIIFTLTTFTLFVLGVFVLIIFNSSPLDDQKSVIPMFFCFEFLCTFLISSLISAIYINKKKYKPVRTYFMKYLGRSLVIATMVLGISLLSSYGVLNLLSGFSFILAIILVDLLIESRLNTSDQL